MVDHNSSNEKKLKKDGKPRKDNRGAPPGGWPGAGRKKGSVQVADLTDKVALARLARQHAHECVEALLKIIRNGQSEAARVAAINTLLIRGYGQPVQSVEVTGKDGAAIEVRESVLVLAALLNKQAEEKTIKVIDHGSIDS